MMTKLEKFIEIIGEEKFEIKTSRFRGRRYFLKRDIQVTISEEDLDLKNGTVVLSNAMHSILIKNIYYMGKAVALIKLSGSRDREVIKFSKGQVRETGSGELQFKRPPRVFPSFL